MSKEQALIQAFIRKPTTYKISVRNNSMLPSKIKKKKEISFTIKPPTPYVLGLCADILGNVQDDVFSKEVDLKLITSFQTEIAQVISVLAHEEINFPDWYVDFIRKNVELIELKQIIQEIAVKCNPGFFLSCFQIAKDSNPMMMTKKK
ncbi:hypothetical protein [Flavicella sediminum]|uniref:hypothetical protein n=1 Tax=Flavicella sediminum TaxID=2585141 RepID=UPI00111D1AB3|nr:hypothetical protein [Flavicella sediminum]